MFSKNQNIYISLRKQNKMKNPPKAIYFFMVAQEYTIGTPDGIGDSHRTIDTSFENFVQDAALREKLRIPGISSDCYRFLAVYLASFCKNPEESERRKNYLLNNGLLRILITDPKLMERVLSR